MGGAASLPPNPPREAGRRWGEGAADVGSGIPAAVGAGAAEVGSASE